MYKVNLDIFEGPLDLLLFLIRKSEIDIHDIPISTLTREYLEAIKAMSVLDLNVAGEFLVVAAQLMLIKSRMLLPVEASDEEDAVCQMWYRWDLDGDDEWDTGWDHEPSKKVEFPGLGEYTVSVEVMDNMGESDIASATAVVVDVTPPVTVATF